MTHSYFTFEKSKLLTAIAGKTQDSDVGGAPAVSEVPNYMVIQLTEVTYWKAFTGVKVDLILKSWLSFSLIKGVD